MNYFEDNQSRLEVEQLHQLAMDAHAEGHYETMERLLEHAVSVAQRLDDLPLHIKERTWLAEAQRMQGKHVQAIATYSWLIALATDPAQQHLLTDPDTLLYLSRGFTNFVACGLFLPQMPVERLLRVVEDGLHWLELMGKPNWTAGLRYLKGRLLKNRGDTQGARLELEAALALKRRHSDAPEYTLAAYQLVLADLLRESTIQAYTEVVSLAEEVLTAPSDIYERRWAYATLAYTRLEMGEYKAALHAAQQSLALAQAMQSTAAVTVAYQLLGRIHRKMEQLAEAVHAAAQEGYWAKRYGSADARQNALADCARVRNLQARAACGLPATWEALPERVPIEAQCPLALRRLHSVRRFVRWATPLAEQLDRANGRRSYQEELDQQLQEAEQLETWLMAEK